MTDLATLVVKLEAQNANYQKGLDDAKKQLKGFQDSVEDTFSDLKKTVIEFFAVDKLAEFASGIIEAEQALDKLSIQTGVAVDELAKLQFAAKQNDVENFSGDLLKLSKSIGEATGGNKQLVADFELLGINLKELQTLSPDKVLLKAADGFAKFADGAGKAALSTQLMGRGGADLIGFLDQGSEGLKKYAEQLDELGGGVTKEQAEEAHEFGVALNELKAAATGAGRGIVDDLLPSLTDAASGFATFISGTKDIQSDFDVIGVSIKSLATAVLTLSYSASVAKGGIEDLFVGAGKEIGAYAAATVAFLQGHTQQVHDILIDAKQDIDSVDAKEKKDDETRELAFSNALGKIWDGLAQKKADAAAEAAKSKFISPDDALAKSLEIDKPNIVLPNVAAITALQDAIKGVQQKSEGISLTDTFKESNEQAARLAVTVGTISDKVKEAGARGKELAAAYIAANRALDLKQDQSDLNKLNQSLQDQISTFDKSTLAVEQYKLSTGKTGAEVTALGEKGHIAATKILESVVALEKLQSVKIDTQIQGELDAIAGNAAKSTAALFDLQHLKERQTDVDAGDVAGVAKLDHLKQLTVVQAEYNQLLEQASDIQRQEALVEAQISSQVANGQKTTLEGQADINAARSAEIDQLAGVQTGLKNLTDQYGNDIPSLVLKTKEFGQSLQDIHDKTNELANTLRTNFADAASNAFTDFVTGAKSASDAIKEFLDNIAKQLVQLASNQLFQNIFGTGTQNSLSGGNTGLGGLVGSLAGLFSGGSNPYAGVAAAANTAGNSAVDATIAQFGGALASGGPAMAGKAYLVGEKRPELFVPSTNGTVVPNAGSWGGGGVTQNFYIQAPDGSVSKKTQVQIGSEASRQLSVAGKRNL